MARRALQFATLIALVASAPGNVSASPEPSQFIAPPRSITDITAILDAEKPDPALIAKLKNDADATPPKSGSRLALAEFYYDRGSARKQLGRMRDALADAEKSVELARGEADSNRLGRMTQF